MDVDAPWSGVVEYGIECLHGRFSSIIKLNVTAGMVGANRARE